jgi:hypothetical protein
MRWGSDDIFASTMDCCEAMACAAVLAFMAEVNGVGGGWHKYMMQADDGGSTAWAHTAVRLEMAPRG